MLLFDIPFSIASFKVPLLKSKRHSMQKTTWKRLRASTCSSASTRCPQKSKRVTTQWRGHQLTANSLLSPASTRSWSSLFFVWLTTYSTATLLMWVEVRLHTSDLTDSLCRNHNGLYSDSPSTVSVHPSRVSGALFQFAHWCPSRLRLHWVSDWGRGLPFTAIY